MSTLSLHIESPTLWWCHACTVN